MKYNWFMGNGTFGDWSGYNFFCIAISAGALLSCCQEADRDKCRAEEWILSNMTSHYTWRSSATDEFEEKVLRNSNPISKNKLNEWWREVNRMDQLEKQYDMGSITSSFLKEDIKRSVNTWLQSPWKKDVPFETFCKYVLPYRVYDEPLISGTRDSLLQRYGYLTKGVTDMKVAFAKVHNVLKDRIKTEDIEYKHNPSALVMERMRMGNCMQRCIHEVSVMRALGLPVTIDGVPFWANYSDKGHSWVALIAPDGTYCMSEKDSFDGPPDSLPRKETYLDSSIFHIRQAIDDDYPYPYNFRKRHSVVTRMTFEYQDKDYADEGLGENALTKRFADPFNIDVSAEYGCTSSFAVKSEDKHCLAYLCTHFTNVGWMPVTYSKKNNGEFAFRNIGDSILCILMAARDRRLHPICYPFLIYGSRISYLKPDTAQTDSIMIDRKYPLIGRFLNNWTELIGGTFEGSNDSMFCSKRILAKITSTPTFRNALTVKGRYRYVRYKSPKRIKSPLAEIEIHSKGKLAMGDAFANGAHLPERCFDGDTFSMLDKTHTGYTVGIDLGRPITVDSIVFYPKNDGNFVLPDHEYELQYFNDGRWITLGHSSQHAYTLKFSDVPHNALLLLKDLTGGKEERPFVFRNGKIEWW